MWKPVLLESNCLGVNCLSFHSKAYTLTIDVGVGGLGVIVYKGDS